MATNDVLADYTQEGHFLSVDTPLGVDELLLTGFSGEEGLSTPFSYRLTMLSKNDNIKKDDLVGKGVTITIASVDGAGPKRYFHGVVNNLAAGSLPVRGLREYQAEIVPQLWFLKRSSDCRIFQKKKIPEIIEQVFSDLSLTDYQLKLTGPYEKLDYCVQYRETAFNFVSRLMEQYGIFYFFRHQDGMHTLVIADHAGAYEDCEPYKVEFDSGRTGWNVIHSWTHGYAYRSGKWAQTDFNFETTPSAGMVDLLTKENSLVKLPGNDKYELFDYPGEYAVKGSGQGLTRIRMEEEEIPHDVVKGDSTCQSFTSGGKFKMAEHPFEAEKGKSYVITAMHHSATDGGYVGTDGSGRDFYENGFTCIPDTLVFRPERTTPKPIISGLQTAIVTGPAGEEIHTDKHGRVKVQFHWDRKGKNDENSSFWIRVAQAWAGKGWGAIFTPRIGHEVVVEFLEGDPDRPLITGSVYNGEMTPPYGLPDEKTKSTTKSHSTLEGGADNFNEIRFEDKIGEEEIFVQAEKDMNITVKNNRATTVGMETGDPGDDKLGVNNDQMTDIGNDRTETVGNDETITISHDRTVTIANNDTLDVGNELLITAASKITLECGGSTIVMTPSDITITAPANAAMDAGANATVTAGANAVLNGGANNDVTAGAILTLSGSLVKIN